MTKDDLDLARAKYMAWRNYGPEFHSFEDEDAWWQMIGPSMRDEFLSDARAIRLNDEARGLRVVPVELVDAIDFWFRQDQHRGAGPIRAKTGYQAALDNLRIVWLAASPFAPGDGK